jgi:HK97 family phage major capsid protein
MLLTMNTTYTPEAGRAGIAAELARFYAELAGTADKPPPMFSLTRVFNEMRTERGLHDGYEKQVCGSAALMNGTEHDAHRVIIPFRALATRDMSIGDGNGSGYIVGTANAAEPFDVLRPWSVVASAGVTVLSGLRENLTIPRISTASSAAWIAEDGVTQYGESQPTVGSTSLTPKVCAVTVNFSHQFQRQAPAVEMLLRQQLLGAVGALLDQAFFAGSGNSGQPLGLLATSNINTATGTSLALAGLLEMRQEILDAGGREENLRWVGPPAMQKLLGARERVAAGGRMLWDDGTILGAPAHATSRAPATTLIAGDFSRAIVALWGTGVRVEIDPYSAFTTGVLSARLVLSCDFAFPQPAAFSVASSIT